MDCMVGYFLNIMGLWNEVNAKKKCASRNDVLKEALAFVSFSVL